MNISYTLRKKVFLHSSVILGPVWYQILCQRPSFIENRSFALDVWAANGLLHSLETFV